MQINRNTAATWSIFTAYACLIVYQFPTLLSAAPLASEDLPAHISLIERLKEHLLSGRIFFYDTAWFGGWPAFQFYGFAPHLLIAIFSIPLGLFSTNSVELATNLSLFLLLATLPISISYCANAFLNDGSNRYSTIKRELSLIVQIFSCSLAIWFLHHDEQFYGIGAGAAIFVGLLTQTFAWHLLLLYLGTLLRSLSDNSKILRGSALIFAMLLLTHPLTAIYALSCGMIVAIWFPRIRASFILSHIISLGLTAFWLLPFISLSKSYTLPDPFPPGGDLLAILARYPLTDLFGLMIKDGVWALSKINIWFVILPLLLVIPFFSREVRRNKLLLPVLLGVIILSVVFSSSFIASSIPLGLHYYRFQAYTVLLIICLASVVPALCSITRDRQQRAVILSRPKGVFWLALAVIGILSTLNLPTLEQKNAEQANKHLPLRVHQEILNELSKNEGRVFFEHFNNYRRFPYLASHQLFSELHSATKRETLNGLFIESSIAYRMPVATTTRLGAETYHSYLVFSDSYDLDATGLVTQLIDLGVSQLVLGSEKIINNLGPFTKDIKQLNPYTIVSLKNADPAVLSTPSRTTLGYIDESGSLPFYLLEFYFYSRSELYKNFELIDLTKQSTIPSSIKTVLIHGDSGNLKNNNGAIERIPISAPDSIFSHYKRSYPLPRTILRFNNLAKHLDSMLKLDPSPNINTKNQTNARFSWQQDKQRFELNNLTQGEFLRINYNYFPLWQCDGGSLYRGSAERMYFLAEEAKAICNYSIRNSGSFWLGMLISIISALLFVFGAKLRTQ